MAEELKNNSFQFNKEKIAEFCNRWKITEFALFGSVLRDDFNPKSDIDVLVSFSDDAHWSLFAFVDMKDELKAIFGREVDLLEKGGLRNPFRRRAILASKVVLYAA
ncbi:MAG: nucleotidyltransferase family protein [Candidatus Schekmanbacteria bacterium]|nr:nucleotidyltransferase family protein [Candidatus Schekmanbacteria bacterium]